MKKIFLLIFLFPVFAHAQIITTIAGGGSAGFSGDNGPAELALFTAINGIAIDGRGNVYIADGGNHRVRKIDTAGIVTTIAGTGVMGHDGDSGPAIAAKIDRPIYMAADSVGNVYFAEYDYSYIRKINTAGIITTVGGNGTGGDAGDGGPATAASISAGSLAADDSGNIYVAANFHNRVRKINTSGVINGFAGTGFSGNLGDGYLALYAEMDSPSGLFADRTGDIYIADVMNNTIRRVDTTHIIHTVAGDATTTVGGYSGDGMPATSSRLYEPYDISRDESGDLYIADNNNHRIRKVDSSGIIHTICGNGVGAVAGDGGPAVSAEVRFPRDVCVDAARNIYFYDDFSRVRKISGISGKTAVCVGSADTLIAGKWGVWSSSNTAIATVASATGIVSGVAAGTAIITYMKYGIKATAVITVNALPPAITGLDSICAGLTDTLSDTLPGGIWTSSNTLVAVVGSSTGILVSNLPGTTSVTYTSPAGCKTAKVVTVDPLPAAGNITGTDSFCVGDIVTLSDVAPGGIWSSGDVSIATITTTGTVNGVSPGTVPISYTVTNSCGTAIASFLLSLRDCPVGIALHGNVNRVFDHFPDPVTDILTVILPPNTNRVAIYNLQGQAVYDRLCNTERARINVLYLSGGLYYILINGKSAGKFLKE